MKYHLTFVRMATREKIQCWWGGGEKELLYPADGNVNWYSHYGKQYGDFLKNYKNKTTIWSNNPISGYIFKGIEIKISNRYLHPKVHCSIVHNSEDMETLKCLSTDKWLKKDVMDIQCNIIHHEEEEIPLSFNNLDETWGYYTKWNNIQKNKQCIVSLICRFKTATLRETGSRKISYQRQRVEEMQRH